MNYLEKFRDITCFVFDIDGVLTDGSTLLLENGRQLRSIHAKDIFALQWALQKGYKVMLVNDSESDGLRAHLQGLGINDLYLGVKDKTAAFEQYARLYNIDPGQVLFMGDDLPDYQLCRYVHISSCPADAAHEIQELVQYVSVFRGGQGCVRDVIEKVMRLDDKWLPDPLKEHQKQLESKK